MILAWACPFNELRPILETSNTYKHDVIVAGDFIIDLFEFYDIPS